MDTKALSIKSEYSTADNGKAGGFNGETYNLSKIGQLNRGNNHSLYARPVSVNRIETSSQPKFYSGSHCDFS
ncbi:MAG: hypothetical protein L3J32_08980 [Rhizobiaceae bacterium]|nr:hypothetical protein [Rhizobiaceae bacterium]